MKTKQEVETAIDTYSDMVQRICFCYLKNHDDTMDIFQNVFMKYMNSSEIFSSKEHEKAWLIRVTINECKDTLKDFFRKKTTPMEYLEQEFAYVDTKHSELFEAVLQLPSKYKNVIYLHYYEGYSALEIASILQMKENTIYSLLSRGRAMLKDVLGGDMDE